MSNKHKGINNGFKRGMTVIVKDNKVDAALRKMKRLMLQEGLTKEMRNNTYYESPSEARVKREAQARSRWKKKLRTMREHDSK